MRTNKNLEIETPALFSAEAESSSQGPVECLGLTFPNDEERRKHFLDKLAEKLKDPEFRKIEGFPIGTDESILALSDPPYYTACPNPWLPDLIKMNGIPYDPMEPYHRHPFAVDVNEGKQDSICMAHTYHTKVPYRAIMRYLLHYTKPGDLILDSFCGTGMAGLAAQLCGSPEQSFRQTIDAEWQAAGRGVPLWGRRLAVLFDLSPFATFLARNFNSNLGAGDFSREAKALLAESENELGWVYETDFPATHSTGKIQYVIWSESVFCECGQELLLWDPGNPIKLLHDPLISFHCPSCNAEVSKAGATRVTSTISDPFLNENIQQNKGTPVLVEAVGSNRVVKKAPTHFDKDLISRIDREEFLHFVPIQPMMFRGRGWGDMFRSGYHFGVSHAHHFPSVSI